MGSIHDQKTMASERSIIHRSHTTTSQPPPAFTPPSPPRPPACKARDSSSNRACQGAAIGHTPTPSTQRVRLPYPAVGMSAPSASSSLSASSPHVNLLFFPTKLHHTLPLILVKWQHIFPPIFNFVLATRSSVSKCVATSTTSLSYRHNGGIPLPEGPCDRK